jgi:hypothetical protein
MAIMRNVSQELLAHLHLEDNKIRPLPGGTGRRSGSEPDPRLSHLQGTSGDEVTFYEHLATIRYKGDGPSRSKDLFFVAFRQTMDALMLEQSDPGKYPEWLMKDPVKKTELKTYIYQVAKHPKQVQVMRSFEDWLEHIADPMVFDTLAYFLLHNKIISQEMYGSLK